MSGRSRTISGRLAASFFGIALLLSACGGTSEVSRNRNSSFAEVDCYQTQELKDADIAAVKQNLESHKNDDAVAEKAKAEFEKANADYVTATSEYEAAKDESKDGAKGGKSDSEAKLSALEKAKSDAWGRQKAAKRNLDSVNLAKQVKSALEWRLHDLESKDLCVAPITPVVNTDSVPPGTDGSIGAAGGSVVETTTTTEQDGTVTSTTVEGDTAITVITEPDGTTTTTTEEVPPTFVNETSTTTVSDPPLYDAPVEQQQCGDPVVNTPDNTLTFAEDGSYEFSVPFCEVSGSRVVATSPGNLDAEGTGDRVNYRLWGLPAGEWVVEIVYTNSSNQPISKVTSITFTVTPKEDPCAGKKPDLTWDKDADLARVTPTCKEADTIWTYVYVVEPDQGEGAVTIERDGMTYTLIGVSSAGSGGLSWIASFATKVLVRSSHFVRSSDAIEVPVGDYAELNVDLSEFVTSTTTAAPSGTDATVTSDSAAPASGGGATTTTLAPEDNSIVRSLPVSVLAADPGTPGARPNSILALPNDTAGVSCDVACATKLAEGLGVKSADVERIEVSLNDGAWASFDNGFAAPIGVDGAVVRIRVTPTSGEVQTVSAKFVNGSVDTVKEGLAKSGAGSPHTVTEQGTTETSSSFPWWIVIVAVLAILLILVFARRRSARVEEQRQ